MDDGPPGGTSPVIGALVLLAIVAVLAAVLGTFALGFDYQLIRPAPQVAHWAGDITDGMKMFP